jgi:catechol 2,3-dioxygenase-like lactoylglutathione lyase family enzyme
MTQLGPLRQLGLVVKDIDSAIEYWARIMGVGPFLVLRNREFDNYEYRQTPSQAPVVSIAIAFTGALQIELIQQHNQAPSAYLEFLAGGMEGTQHLCAWFDSRAAYDVAHAKLTGDGMVLVHQGRSRGVDMRFAYFEAPGGRTWPMIEISEGLLPVCRAMFESLQSDSVNWDGVDAYREIRIEGN